MNKSILVLKGLNNSRRSKLLNRMEKIIKLFEIVLFIAPSIRWLQRNSQLIVISYDYEVLKFLALFGIRGELIKEEFNKKELEEMFKKSLELFDKLFNNIDESKIKFKDINVLQVIQEEIVNLVFDVIKKLSLADSLIENMCPTSIYVDDTECSICQTFIEVATNNKIAVKSILPDFYIKPKNKIEKYLLYTRSKIPSINSIQLLTLNNNDTRKLLAFVPYINFAEAVLPVIEKLIEKNLFKEIYIVGEKTSVLNKFKHFTEVLINSKDIDLPLVDSKNIKEEIFVNLNREFIHNIFSFHNINFWNVIKYDLYYITKSKIEYLVFNLEKCNYILDTIKPNIVVVGDERTSYIRTCVSLAKQKSIPIIEIQHGIYSSMQPKIPPISDIICVWGKYSKDNFLMSEVAKSQIVITGCPKFDSLVTRRKNEYIATKQRSCRKILLATQYGFEDITTVIIEKITDFLDTEKDICLIIKPHPAEKKGQYYKFTKKSQRVFLKDPRVNIDNLLLDADILITISSTVGINAAILDVPIVLINLNKRISAYSPISFEVKDAEEIIPSIKSALFNEVLIKEIKELRDQFVYENAYLQDGKASERVIDLIQILTKK